MIVDTELRRSFEQSIQQGNLLDVIRQVESHPELLNSPLCASLNCLHYAAREGQQGIVNYLVSQGVDLNSTNLYGDTPLTAAINGGHLGLVRHLLSLGATPNTGRMLISALNNEKHAFEFVKLLVEHGADVNQVWRFGDEVKGPLFNALSWSLSRPEIADYLRAHGAVMPPIENLPAPKNLTQKIVKKLQSRLGPVNPLSLQQVVSTFDPPLAIHVAPPHKKRTYQTLFTAGLSEQPLTVPEGMEAHRYVELMIHLPADWSLDKSALADPNHFWPIYWLHRVAAYACEEQGWLGFPAGLMVDQEPPQPFAPNCPFTAMLLIADYEEGKALRVDNRVIRVYTLLPLYPEEYQLEREHGLPELFNRFDQAKVHRAIDLNRVNVAKK